MLKYRQGDVALELITDLPEGLEFKPSKNAVLAEGEVTGHFHVLTCEKGPGFPAPTSAPEHAVLAKLGGKTDGTQFPLEIAEKDGTMFLRVAEPLPLKHAEHATITVEPGTYKVTRQREYAPEAPRQVAD